MDNKNTELDQDQRRDECFEAINEMGRAMSIMDEQRSSGIEPDIEPLRQAMAKLERAIDRNNLERLSSMNLDDSRQFILFTEKRRALVEVALSWLGILTSQLGSVPNREFARGLNRLRNICSLANIAEKEEQLQRLKGLMLSFKEDHPDLNLKEIELAD